MSACSVMQSTHSFIFKDQYIELTTRLPRDADLYGIGEVSLPTGLLLPRDGTTITLWARDMPSANPYANLYGSHPFYLQLNSGEQPAAGATAGAATGWWAGQRSGIGTAVLEMNGVEIRRASVAVCLRLHTSGMQWWGGGCYRMDLSSTLWAEAGGRWARQSRSCV